MEIDLKEALLAIALIATFTTSLVNIWDRRKFYSAERFKIQREHSQKALSTAGFIEDKYNLYKNILVSLSLFRQEVHYSHRLLSSEKNNGQFSDIDCKTLTRLLEKIPQTMRENPLVIPSLVHEKVARDLVIQGGNIIEELKHETSNVKLKNHLSNLLGISDRMKSTLELDFNDAFDHQ